VFPAAEPDKRQYKASNNHLIPASPAMARQIGSIRVGDQIRMTGLLACEIRYVSGLSVVVRGNRLETDAGRYLGYASFALFVALGWVWFVRPPVAE
jgi:hypothetical protein